MHGRQVKSDIPQGFIVLHLEACNHRCTTSKNRLGVYGENRHSKPPLQVRAVWTRAAGWDRVETTDVPQREGLEKGWESGEHALPPSFGGLGRGCRQFVVSRRLVTTYASASSPIRHALSGRTVACLQHLHAGVCPDRSRPAARAGGRCVGERRPAALRTADAG